MSNPIIKKLVSDLKPVSRLHKARRLVTWVSSVVLFSVVLLYRFSAVTYHDCFTKSGSFWIDMSLVFLMLVFTARSAFMLCSPTKCYATAFVFFIPFLIFLGKAIVLTILGGVNGCVSPSCMIHAVLLTVIPFLMLFIVSRGNYSTHPKLFVFFVTLSGGTVGVLLLNLICLNNDSGHMLISHLGPVFLLSLLMSVCSSFFLKKL